jgi:hypothetical protein
MPVNSKIYLNTFDQHATVQATLEVDSSRPADSYYEPDVVHISLLIIPFIGWCALLTSLLIAFFKSRKSEQTSMLEQVERDRSILKSKYPIPCAQCRFFASNSYVHCAVHPSKVLTAQAVNCSDYYSS